MFFFVFFQGEEECFIEIDNLDDINLNEWNHFGNYSNEKTTRNSTLNYSNYTGILYTQTDKKYIDFDLKDFYPINKSILINGTIPSKFFPLLSKLIDLKLLKTRTYLLLISLKIKIRKIFHFSE